GCQSNILSIIQFKSVVPTDYRFAPIKFDFWNLIKERFDSSVDYRTKINNILSKLKRKNSLYFKAGKKVALVERSKAMYGG
ncbi:hypothetical protein, partial [Streptococcus pneumoniae]